MDKFTLYQIYTIAEAALLWNKSPDTLKDACNRSTPRFTPTEHRKSSGTWLITYNGLYRLYGQPLKKTHPISQMLTFELTQIYTVNEAALLWGKHPNTIKDACDGHSNRCSPRLTPNECRKSGRTWLITSGGLIRLYGLPISLQKND